MAHLIIPRAQDNSGNASSGAKVYVYEHSAPTTLAEIYSTAEAVEGGGDGNLANPLTADSAGRFATIFVAETAVVDWRMETSAGVLMQEQLGVKGVPGSPVAINLDFGDDGRFSVDGSGSVVNIEAGDPTGDNVGGDLRIGGWANTPLNTLELETNELEVSGDMTVGGAQSVTGEFDFDGGQTADLLIAEGENTTGGTGVIELPSGYEMWEIDIFDSIPGAATGSGPRLQFSFDDGATYKSTNEYNYGAHYVAGGLVVSNTTAAAYVELTPVDNGNGGTTAAHIRVVITSHGSTLPITAWWDGTVISSTSTPHRLLGTANMVSAYGVPTHVKVYRSAGSHNFRYYLKARRRRAA